MQDEYDRLIHNIASDLATGLKQFADDVDFVERVSSAVGMYLDAKAPSDALVRFAQANDAYGRSGLEAISAAIEIAILATT